MRKSLKMIIAMLFVTLALVSLKAFGFIEANWLWVCSPIWIPLSEAFILVCIEAILGDGN